LKLTIVHYIDHSVREGKSTVTASPQHNSRSNIFQKDPPKWHTLGGNEVESTNTLTSAATITDDNVTGSFLPNYGFPAPMNLHLVDKPFKNPRYKTPKKLKNLKQILAAERNQNIPLNVPTYSNIEAPPSIFPQKKYCDLTGLE
ncbi:6648_t:CDS:2, partial [Entrophospora sp. SA101]